MKRLALAACAAMLVLPASANATSTHSGVILSVKRHSIQVVNPVGQVGAYRLAGHHVPLHVGSRVDFTATGINIKGLRVVGVSTRITYLASVLHAGSAGIVLVLADGDRVSFSKRQIAGSAPGRRTHLAFSGRSGAGITLTIEAPPGTTVQVTETFGPRGAINVTLTIDPGASVGGGSGSGSGGGSGSSGANTYSNDQQAAGIVTDVENDNFGIVTGDGTVIRLGMNPNDLADVGINPCDTVEVSYHDDAGNLIADYVDDNGSSDAGACDTDGTFYPTQDQTGPITAVSDTGITIDTADEGPIRFPVDPSLDLTEGLLVGDDVDVTYEPVPDGTLYVTEIEYVENDSTGVVTSVSGGSLTITDDSTGQPDVFVADPSEQMFAGIAVGDEVDVTWHQAAGSQMVADYVEDDGSPAW